MPLKLPELVLFLLTTALNFSEDACRCSTTEGTANGVIVDATCHANGTVEYTTRLNVHIEAGIHLEYNCTGRNQSSGVLVDFANPTGGPKGLFQVEDWNYTSSICYFDGCYDTFREPTDFPTFSISSTACIVVVPSSARAMATSVPVQYTSEVLATPFPSAIPIQHDLNNAKKTLIITLPSVTSVVILMLLLVCSLALVLLLVSRRQKGKHRNYWTADQVNENGIDIFHLKIDIRASKSLETITDHLYYDDENVKVTRNEEQDTDGSVILGSSSELEIDSHSSGCDTYPLSEPSPGENSIGFNRMFRLGRSDCPSTETSGQVSEYMFMAGHSIASTAQLNEVLFEERESSSCRSVYFESDQEESDHLNMDTSADVTEAAPKQEHTNNPEVVTASPLQVDDQSLIIHSFNEEPLFHDSTGVDTTGFSTGDSSSAGYIDCSHSVTRTDS